MTFMVASSSNEKMELTLPEQLRKAGGWTPEQLQVEVRFLLAAELFALKKVSLGRATELSGMVMVDFMARVSALGIPVIDLSDDEMREEFRRDRTL